MSYPLVHSYFWIKHLTKSTHRSESTYYSRQYIKDNQWYPSSTSERDIGIPIDKIMWTSRWNSPISTKFYLQHIVIYSQSILLHWDLGTTNAKTLVKPLVKTKESHWTTLARFIKNEFKICTRRCTTIVCAKRSSSGLKLFDVHEYPTKKSDKISPSPAKQHVQCHQEIITIRRNTWSNRETFRCSHGAFACHFSN